MRAARAANRPSLLGENAAKRSADLNKQMSKHNGLVRTDCTGKTGDITLSRHSIVYRSVYTDDCRTCTEGHACLRLRARNQKALGH